MASERWIRGVTVIIHEENDGATFLRRGSEGEDTEMSLENAVLRHGRDWVLAQLKQQVESVKGGNF